MAVTDTWKKYATEAVFNGTPVSVSVFYAGLGTSSFSVGANDAPIGEVTNAGYQRVPIQWSEFATNMTNTNSLVFGATEDWPPVGHVFIADAAQGGAVVGYGSPQSVTAESGDTITVVPGDLQLT